MAERDLVAQLTKHRDSLQDQIDRINAAIKALAGALPVSKPGPRKPKRKLTAAQRAEISKRMKASWAKRKASGKA